MNATAYEQHFAVPLSYQQRSYQFLKLANGMVGIIMTDPTEDLATCSLSVATGHHANPEHIPGLAHFCEHMVCVSSYDYPEIDAYKIAVSKEGGTMNALTTNEITSYFFSIPVMAASNDATSSFERILDIFTSNFSCPKFDSAYSNREIYSVDNEHTVNKSNKKRLSFQGFKLLANQHHQFARFSTGDFESLKESCSKYNIKDHLVEFYNKEYTSDKMSFVLRGPYSLNHLQKLAISKFGKIGKTKNYENGTAICKTVFSKETFGPNIIEKAWENEYECRAFTSENTGKAIIINKNVDPILRIAFPICFKDTLTLFSLKEVQFYINFWCEIFGSETERTIASALISRDLIGSISTKTSTVTYDTVLLEMELLLSDKGLQQVSTIIDIIFSYVRLYKQGDKKFNKHLAKSMSQFNGLGIFNFLHFEENSEAFWEARSLSDSLLSDISLYGQWFVQGLVLYDYALDNYSGSYSENESARLWWNDQANNFCKFINSFTNLSNTVISCVGNLDSLDLSWVIGLPSNFQQELNFEFEFKIAKINEKVIRDENLDIYNLNLSPPNNFCNTIVNEQTKLLQLVDQTIENSKTSSLGYSIKNTSLLHKPELVHHEDGFQLWMKNETDDLFNKKVLFSMELINTKINPNPSLVAVLEIIVQLVKNRVREYLYPALTVNYSYDIFPSFNGDAGVLLHVSGFNQNFSKVLKILVYELKLVVESFNTSISREEFEEVRESILEKYRTSNKLSSLETSMYGLFATVEEYTWLIDERINCCQILSFDDVSHISSTIFQSGYLSAFLQGDIKEDFLKNEILPVVKQLVKKFEGENHSFPSTVLLPKGSNFQIKTKTNDSTNCIEYFVQVCKRDNKLERSITKFIAFLMKVSLTNKIRGEYQLGYIVLIGTRSLRKTLGVHISIVSGGFDALELELKLESILSEWYDQLIKKLKAPALSNLVEKFIATENSSNSLNSSGPSSLFFGAMGSSNSNKKTVKQHNSFWEQIVNKTYAFNNKIGSDDEIDIDIIQKLTVEQLQEFIRLKVLPSSSDRSKLSILVDSNCTKEEISQHHKSVQMYMFLSMMGLPIKKNTLEKIIHESGNSQILLCKNLYRYYREQGKSITTIGSVMAKFSKSFLLTSATGATRKFENPIPPSEIDVKRIHEWQSTIGFVRDEKPLKQRLDSL